MVALIYTAKKYCWIFFFWLPITQLEKPIKNSCLLVIFLFLLVVSMRNLSLLCMWSHRCFESEHLHCKNLWNFCWHLKKNTQRWVIRLSYRSLPSNFPTKQQNVRKSNLFFLTNHMINSLSHFDDKVTRLIPQSLIQTDSNLPDCWSFRVMSSLVWPVVGLI